MDAEQTVTPAVEPTVPATEPEAPTSLSEHEEQFPVTSKYAPPSDPPKPEQDETTGRFKGRHRANSQKAGPADVPRIAELTKKLREVEEERDRLKAAPVAKPPEPPAPIPPKPPTPPSPTALTKPDPNDTKYPAGPYDPQFQEDLAEWKFRSLSAQDRAAETERQKQQQLAVEKERLGKAWTEKIASAKAKYADFQKVALESPTRIPPGSLTDGYILEATDGADVLYHLQRPEHAAELDAILALPPFEQIKTLTLLGQRLTQPQAGTTGSAAVVTPSSVPRPPNPVRTGPMRSGDEPPDPATGSLRDHERFYGRQRQG